jgi:hypothetical protein
MVKEAEIDDVSAKDVHGAIWLVIFADGLDAPFSTTPRTVTSGKTFNFPARLLLKVPDVQNAYLYVTLCTYGPDGTKAIPLAKSRVGLRSLPQQFARAFRFPLMKYQNGAQPMAHLSLEARMQPINAVPHSTPGSSGPPLDPATAGTIVQTNPV